MEGLYHNTNANLYPSSSYMMQHHPDHPPYYSPPSTLPYRPMGVSTTTASSPSPVPPPPNSAFSDVRPYNGVVLSSSPSSPHSDSVGVAPHQHHQSHRSNSITSLPTSTSSMVGWPSSSTGGYSWPNQYPPSNHYSAVRPSPSYTSSTSCYSLATHTPNQRPKLTTTVWEDEGTVCYQVDYKSGCVARRQDNDMINGTKLLNVVGMSRGKRDGILKNEKGRVVVKVGAMHLKGVWITFERAKDLAAKFKVTDILYPLFTDDPSVYLCPTAVPGTSAMTHSDSAQLSTMAPRSMAPPSFQYRQEQHSVYGFSMPPHSFTSILRSNDPNDLPSGSCSPVPGTIAPLMVPASDGSDLYLMNNSYDYPLSSSRPIDNGLHHSTPPSHYFYSSSSSSSPSSSSPGHQQQPRLASISHTSSSPTYNVPGNYDTFSRKHTKPTTYPHSPPHEETKYNPTSQPSTAAPSSLLNHSSSSANSNWYQPLTSQLSDCAKTVVPPPLRSPRIQDALISDHQQSKKRSAPLEASPKRSVKRVHVLND